MKKTVIVILTALLIFANIQIAAAVTPNPKALKDSKPEKLTVADQIYLKQDTIALNSITKVKILVNRATGKVSYVFHNNYKRYVRPKFVMPDAQALYDKAHGK